MTVPVSMLTVENGRQHIFAKDFKAVVLVWKWEAITVLVSEKHLDAHYLTI